MDMPLVFTHQIVNGDPLCAGIMQEAGNTEIKSGVAPGREDEESGPFLAHPMPSMAMEGQEETPTSNLGHNSCRFDPRTSPRPHQQGRGQ